MTSLIGATADVVLQAPAAYPPVDRPDLVRTALEAGKVCRLEFVGARVLMYLENDAARAAVTELAHGGYRRKYKAYAGADVEDLLRKLKDAYPVTP